MLYINLISFILTEFFLFKSLLRLYCFKSQVILFVYCLFGSCVSNWNYNHCSASLTGATTIVVPLQLEL